MAIVYPKKILIVDDEEDTLISLGNILRRANYIVSTTTNGEEAIKLAKANHPDLVILDIVLPGLDGGSVADILSNDPATANTPILFLTGILSKEEELQGRKEGGKKSGKHYMMAKPVSAEDIREILSKILPS